MSCRFEPRSAFVRAFAVALLAAVTSAHRAQSGARAPAASAADVTDVRISPDSARVAYLADAEIDDAFELHCVPILGGPSVRLSPRPVAGGDVRFALFSPDSRRVVFVGDLDSDEVFELYAAPVSGRAAVALSPPMQPGGDVFPLVNLDRYVHISPDSRRVAFLADAERDGVVELYGALLAGGPPVKLSLPLSDTGSVGELRITSGGERVVYLAAFDSASGHELYSVPLAGGASTRLSVPLAPGATVATQDGFALAASKRVVYAVGSRLYSVSELGGPSVELADTGRSRVIFRLDPRGRNVFYIAAAGSFATEVRSVPIEGGPSVRLSPAGSFDRITWLQVGADGRWLVYYVDNGDAIEAAYAVPASGGAVVELARPASGEVLGVSLTSDERRVIVELHDGDIEWYSMPTHGGVPVLLLSGWYAGGIASPDSSSFVYRTAPPGAELFSVPIGGGLPVPLSPPPVAGGEVQRLLVSPDSRRVVYAADQDVDEVVELYSVPLAGGPPVQLNPEFGSPP